MLTKLKFEIEKSGLKQSHIAHVLDLDHTLLSHYVRGERKPPDHVVKDLARLLHVKREDIEGIVK